MDSYSLSTRQDTIWILGARGRIGRSITQRLHQENKRLVTTDHKALDITNLEDILIFMERNLPAVVINAAGMSRARDCEENPEEAFRVNALGAKNLAIACNYYGAKLIHISTDDIFNGQDETPATELHEPDPTTVYGKTKHYGEKFIQEFCKQYFIVRSSWVYDYKTIEKIKQGLKNHSLVINRNQVASPTSNELLTKFIVRLVDSSDFGIYHYTTTGSTSRKGFIEEIAKLLGLEEDYKQCNIVNHPSLHPHYALMDNFMLRMKKEPQPPLWQDELKSYIQNYYQKIEVSVHEKK